MVLWSTLATWRSASGRYHVLPHNSPECVEIVREHGLDLAVIAGARILKRSIIEAFQVGIINLHPGLIPDARGLDALLWSVYRDVPLGVTAHLIDHRVDAGRILIRQEIPILCDDTVLDLSERLYDQQLDMLSPAIERARRGEGTLLSHTGCCNRKMPAELEVEALARIPEYVARRRTCD